MSGNQCNSHNTVLSGRFQGHCCWTTNGFWAYSIETDITQIRTNPNFPYWFHHFLWLDHDHMYHLSSVFDSLHSLGHPIIRATHKLVTTCYVWPDVNKDVHQWARSYLKCQKSKVYHHTVTPLSAFPTPDVRSYQYSWSLQIVKIQGRSQTLRSFLKFW